MFHEPQTSDPGSLIFLKCKFVNPLSQKSLENQRIFLGVGGGQDAVGAVEADEIPGVDFVEQLAVRFIQTDAGVPANQSQDQIDLLRVSANQSQDQIDLLRVSANQSQDQVDLLRGVRSRVDGMRAAGFVLQ